MDETENFLNDEDPIAALRAEVDQHKENAKLLMPALAAEYKALCADGVNMFAAAVIVGQRWKWG